MSKIIEFPKSKDSGRRSPASASELWRSIDRIRIALDLPEERLRHYLGMTAPQVEAARARGIPPSIASLQGLCSSIGLSLETLLTGKMDLKALARQNLGDVAYLPERYSTGAFSRRSTAANLLNFVELRFGWEKRAALLKRFQLTEAHFERPTDWISIRFTLDAATHLFQSHRSHYQLREIGHHSTTTHWNSGLGKLLRKQRSVKEVYEAFAESLVGEFLERNYDWEIESLGRHHCIITGHPSEELVDAIGPNECQNRLGCEIRKGIFEAVPAYLNLPHASVTKLTCVADGDHACSYHVDFTGSAFRRFDESRGLVMPLSGPLPQV